MSSESFLERLVAGKFVLIAEIGVNYYDIARKDGITPMEAAKLMCLLARDAGVHAVKFQSYKAETLAVRNSPSYWDTSEEATTSQYELFKKFDSFGEPEYGELARYCNEIGIAFCSTAFDFESVDYLDPLQDVFKISSSDLTNLPFIEYQAAKGKPMILSVGAGDVEEISEAVQAIRSVSGEPLVLCHCVLEYPTPYEDAHLDRIRTLAQAFPGVIVGYSDHCKPDENYDVIKTAFSLGATVVEKHFTLDKNLAGNDHYHAMDPGDAKRIVEGVSFIEALRGDGSLEHLESERAARLNARRSIVSRRAIPAGAVVRRDDVTFKRPGTGISPKYLDAVIGAVALCDIAEDTVIQKAMLGIEQGGEI